MTQYFTPYIKKTNKKTDLYGHADSTVRMENALFYQGRKDFSSF